MKSKNYYQIIEKYKVFHTKGTKLIKGSETFKLYSLSKSIVELRKIIKETNSSSIIDFGCGKAMYYFNSLNIEDIEFKSLKEYWGVKEIILYDPAVKIFSKYPWKQCDGIISTDVLEHIPEDDILEIIDDIFSLAKKFVYFVIAIYPASKFFENGENIHLCLKSKEEWSNIFENFNEKYPNIEQIIRFND